MLMLSHSNFPTLGFVPSAWGTVIVQFKTLPFKYSSIIYYTLDRAVGSILKPVWLFSSIGMTLNLIIEEVVFLV